MITGYVIQYVRVGIFQSDDKMIMNIPNNTTLTISGLIACAEYSVTVAAVNTNGTGPFSKPVKATSGEDSELIMIQFKDNVVNAYSLLMYSLLTCCVTICTCCL